MGPTSLATRFTFHNVCVLAAMNRMCNVAIGTSLEASASDYTDHAAQTRYVYLSVTAPISTHRLSVGMVRSDLVSLLGSKH